MGNRGILHDANNQIVRPWAHRSWVTCLLEYGNLKRPKPFSPGNYSELFFLDEATAFAAGHRPCNFCQRTRSRAFKSAWLEANVPIEQHESFAMSALDAHLHAERVGPGRSKGTYRALFSDLPDGAMFQVEGLAYLAVGGVGHQWSFQGYSDTRVFPADLEVSALTPRSVVAAFSKGFRPRWHPTGGS